MSLRRRSLLFGGLAGFAGGSFLLRHAFAATQMPHNLDAHPKFVSTPFTLGVASGDPESDGFVLWTRLAPTPLEEAGGMVLKPVLVNWEISENETMSRVVSRGQAIAHPELAHSVHVEVAGLKAARPYWYRFSIAEYQSPIGRAQTLPAAGASVERVRFAAAGCQHYEEGHYTAWRAISQEPVDFVYHYGDYIYEGKDSRPGYRKMNGQPFKVLRRHMGPECYSLDEYRRRYAQYKTDADLQAAHAATSWFVSFDDHEVDNNWAGDTDQDHTPEEVFLFRRAVAMQAYYEHMPLRRKSLPNGSHMQIYRNAQYGDLLNVFVLDTRQYRSDQAYGDKDGPQREDVWAPDRSMMGTEQEQWLFNGLAQSGTRWNLLAHQVMMLNLGHRKSDSSPLSYSMDQWSGYLYSRKRLLEFVQAHCPGNVVNVTGDAHRHFAGDLLINADDKKPASVEFLATSITSGSDGAGDDDGFSQSVRRENPWLKATTDKRGYVLCDVGRDHWRGDLKVVDQVMQPDGVTSTYASFVTERGQPGLQKA
ncbi:alkaline phosphatase [Acetobacter cibinongensis]|uniref:Alkaline phosphatase n=1 Tax=Acetobacter cibinongensis TaxID=146475 RepID=A0A0D6N6Q8_9PROT|nr:alkaline phosphatase D family protein [Acetobacter cibinongensis]GAN61727.1 alkaline phosphatase [Acetobacter cibinongensis]GEL59622.1 alkaline phosphatase [Acetobacter cibinongensis]